MALSKITYTDKETLNPLPSVADKNKVTDDDMNEIKSVVNSAIDQVEANTIPQQATAPISPSENDLWIDTDEPGLTEVDSVVSTTSTNPIENQAITNFVKGEVLYYDIDGTTSTVNLSDSVANYDYIEIFFKNAQYTPIFSSVKVYKPSNTNVGLVAMQTANGGTGIVGAYVNISGTTITKVDYNIFWTNGGNEHTDKIYITRVMGYK